MAIMVIAIDSFLFYSLHEHIEKLKNLLKQFPFSPCKISAFVPFFLSPVEREACAAYTVVGRVFYERLH